MVCGMGLEKVWSVVWVKAKNITPKIARRREALKKGSARRSFLKGRERAIVNETNVGSVSETSKRRGGAHTVFSSA